MANVRTCVFLLVLLVNYRLVAPELPTKKVVIQPTFGTQIWCSMFCGDDDDDDDSSEDSDDYSMFDLFDICYGCSSKPSSPATTTTEKPMQQPVKLMIPPSTGMNLTVFSNLGEVLMGIVPWLAAPSSAPATTSAPTTAAPAAPAGNSTNATAAG